MENAGLFNVSEVTITLAPVALSAAGWVAYDPTATLPKSMVVGVMASWPTGALVPVPVSGIVRLGSEASEVTEMLPLSSPADGGEKVIVKVMCCPGVRTTGGVKPLMLKPVPVMAA